MTDIVRRLRYEAEQRLAYRRLSASITDLLIEAADEIVRLRTLADIPAVPEPTGQPW